MPILQYIGWGGASLVALLFFADWYLPRHVTESSSDTIRPVIRIASLQAPPERVFIDTSVPTTVPSPKLFEEGPASPTLPPPQSIASSKAMALMESETSVPTKDTGVRESRGTLTEADRLDVPHRQLEAPGQRISSVNRRSRTDVAALIPATKGVVQHTRTAVKTANMEKSKAGSQHRKNKPAQMDRSNAVVQVKSCPQNVFAGVLKALNISRGCET